MSQPSWLSTGQKAPLRTQEFTVPDYGANENGNDKSRYIYWLGKCMIVTLCILMALTACMGFSELEGINSVGRIFVAIYMLCFALLLLAFEISEVRPYESLNNAFKRNFGFLYNTKGKAFFIIFIGFLSFGLGEPATLSTITGCLFATLGIAQVTCYLKYPEWFTYQPQSN